MRKEDIKGIRFIAEEGNVIKVNKNGELYGFFESFPVLDGANYEFEEMTKSEKESFIKENNNFLANAISHF